MKLIVHLFFLVTLFSLAACSSFKPKLNNSVKQSIDTLRVVSIIDQPLLGIQYNRANNGGTGYLLFGVAGAVAASLGDSLVNADRLHAALEKMAPFHAALIDKNTTQMLIDGLEATSGSLPWANTVFLSYKGAEAPKKGTLLSELKEDALLLLNTSYSMTPELESLEITISVSLYEGKYRFLDEKEKRTLLRNQKPIYRGGVKFQSRLYGGRYRNMSLASSTKKKQAIITKYDHERFNSSRDKRIYADRQKKRELKRLEASVFEKVDTGESTEGVVWLENNAELLKNTIDLGIAEITELLALDLNDHFSTYDYKNAKEEFKVAVMTGGKMTKLISSTAKGWLLDTTDSRVRIRLEDGYIYSVAKGDFLRPIVGNRSSGK